MKIIRLACITVLFLSVGACKVPELRNPDPIKVAPRPDATHTAIQKALAHRGWLLTQEEPGKMYATLHLRAHTAKILITYDADQVSIQYLDSQNLKYRKDTKGKEYIHQNYNVWVNNLLRDISVFTGPGE